jgi:hypothetical protein
VATGPSCRSEVECPFDRAAFPIWPLALLVSGRPWRVDSASCGDDSLLAWACILHPASCILHPASCIIALVSESPAPNGKLSWIWGILETISSLRQDAATPANGVLPPRQWP